MVVGNIYLLSWIDTVAEFYKQYAQLALASTDLAVRSRGYHKVLSFHSDRGTEYWAGQYRERLSGYGIGQSMNRSHTRDDNAFMESFSRSSKTERIKDIVLEYGKTTARNYYGIYALLQL